MRTASISLVVIGLALAAIVAGFLSGNATRPPPYRSVVTPDGVSQPVVARLRDFSDSAVEDIFSNDPVVIDRPALPASGWLSPRISIVAGLCGDSVALASGFFALDVPVALDIDPNARESVRLAAIARGATPSF